MFAVHGADDLRPLRTRVRDTLFPDDHEQCPATLFIVFHFGEGARTQAVTVLDDLLRRRAPIHNIACAYLFGAIAQAHDAFDQGRAAGNVVEAIA